MQIQKTTKILSPGEEKSLDRAIEDLKDMRDGVEIKDTQGVSFEIQDKASINKKITDLEKIKRDFSVPKISSSERERYLKELNELEAELRVGMPSWDEFFSLRPQHGPRYQQLLQWQIKSQADQVRQDKVRRWKLLRRLTNPDDPQAGNVMYLHPH